MNTLTGYSKSTLTNDFVLSAAGGHLAVGNADKNIPINNGTVSTNLNADLLDDHHETAFMRYRGNIETSYVDLATYTSNATGYKNPSLGIYSVGRSGHSDMMIHFNGSGSTSGLDLLINYNNESRIQVRKNIDSNRVSGAWKTIAWKSDIPTKLSGFTDDILSGKYYPITGGRINGNELSLGTSTNYKSAYFRIFNNTSDSADYGTHLRHYNDGKYQGLIINTAGLYYSNNGSDSILIHTGNYNNYSPTLTGGGASGDWAINITGNAATANSLKVTSCTYNGAPAKVWNTIKVTSSPLRFNVYDSYNEGGPSTYGNIIEIVGIHNHWQPQLWFDAYAGGYLRHRNKGYDDNTWGDWHIILDSNNYGSYLGYIGTTSVLKTSATLNLTGIGTISMGNKISSSSTSFLINADGSKELFYYNASGPYLSIGYGSAGAGYTTYLHGNKVQLRYGKSASEGAILDSAGNFGIGTTAPTHKLHVKGSTKLEGNNEILSFSPDYTDTWSDGTHSHPWYGYDHRYAATGVYSTTISDYFGLTLRTGSGNLSITTGGNVGIGTYNPTAKLQVEGGITMTGTLLLYIHNIKSTKYNWALTSGKWYRIMVSDSNSVADSTGELVIYLHNAGSPSTVKLSFGVSYHNYPFLFCNWATAWSGTSITKARIVYRNPYGNLKAYLEVYANQTMTHETTFSFLGTGWSFMTPTATTEAYTESLNSKCEISITSGTTRFSNDIYAPNFIGTVAWSNISGKPNIPNPTSYYWANVGVSSTSSNTTTPIFGNVRIGGTKTLSSAWKNGLVVGPDGSDKVVMTYLDSSTDGATIGAHNSDLSAWSVLNVSGSSIYFRSKEAVKMTMTSAGDFGIGTTSPSYKLDVSGGARFSYALANYYRYAHWGSNLPHASGNAWYNVYSSTINTAGDNIILKLSHSYYYTQTDSVIFAINVGYGTASITLLNSTSGSGIFKTIRVRFVNSKTVYVDVEIYSHTANTDFIYVSGTGTGTFCSPTATSDTTGKVAEISIFYNGFYTPKAKIDTLNGGTPITSANIGSQSVSNADTTDGVHLEWAGSQAASSTDWLAGWTSDGKKLKAVKRADLSVNYASSAGNADTVDNCHASYFGYNKGSGNYDCNTVGTHFAAYRFSNSPTNAFPSSAYGNMLVIGADGDTLTQIGCPYSADEMYFRRGTWYADGSGSIKNNTWKKILHNENSSVSGGGSSWGSSISVKIGGTTATLTIPSNPNTWRGITNTYTGSDLTISVSQYGTNALYNALVNGYASSAGNADTVDNYHMANFGHYKSATSVSNTSGSTWYIKVVLNLNWNSDTHYLYCNPGYNNINGLFTLEIPSYIGTSGYTAKVSSYNGCNINAFVYVRESDKVTVYLRLVGNSAGYCALYSTAGITSATSVSAPSVSWIGCSGMQYITNYSYTASHFYEHSDIRFKKNIKPITGIDNIPQLKEFDWRDSGKHSYGLIAQELEEMGYKDLVEGDEDGIKTVNYSAALSLIVGKLQVKIRELEKEIENLKSKN